MSRDTDLFLAGCAVAGGLLTAVLDGGGVMDVLNGAALFFLAGVIHTRLHPGFEGYP